MIYVIIYHFLFIAFGILFYFLWVNGYVIISKKTAAFYVGSLRRKGRFSIKFKSCNGLVKKVIKINDSRKYLFNLNSNITKGDVSAEVLDKNKEMLLQLDKENPVSDLTLDKNRRYYLVIKFKNASGELELTWN